MPRFGVVRLECFLNTLLKGLVVIGNAPDKFRLFISRPYSELRRCTRTPKDDVLRLFHNVRIRMLSENNGICPFYSHQLMRDRRIYFIRGPACFLELVRLPSCYGLYGGACRI